MTVVRDPGLQGLDRGLLSWPFFLEMIMSRLRLISFMVMTALMIPLLAGGGDQGGHRTPAKDGKTYLSVEFPADTTLKYHIISSRSIMLDLAGPAGRSKDSSARQEMKEEADLVIAYTAAGSAGRGGTLVDAKCLSAKVERQKLTGGSASDDALTTLSGKSFRMSVSATGQIFETSELDKVIQQLGEAAFGNRNDRYEGRKIKNPDMIADFIAVQWFMWDQEQSVPRPTQGVAPGQEWKSKRKLLAPFPFVARVGRDATYTLSDVTKSPDGSQLATIKSVYSLAEGSSMDWPMPYTGTFSQRGSFGFFQGYKVQELTGEGKQIFDVTTGRINSERQSYKANISAVIPFGGLGKDGEKPEPNIVVNQVITIELMTPESVVK
jgi:hypothetical protein